MNFELKIVKELQATELTYVNKLRLLIRMYSRPLQQLQASGHPLIDEASWRQIFDNTEAILSLAEKFLERLTKRPSGGMPSSPHEHVISAFSDLVAFFKLYSSYFDKYQQGTEKLLSHAASHSEFVEFLQIAQVRGVETSLLWCRVLC